MSSASVTTSTGASAVALTTIFTPATTCSGLTFSAPTYSIWYNEPVPAATITETGCYPSQWLAGYTSLATSSIAPALNPLVCPSGWTTALNSTSSYIACCPTGYAVHFPDTTVDSDRPAYGGLCFSGFTAGTTLTVVQYNSTGVMQTATVPFSSSGQIFAHIIDGYATQHVAAISTSSANSTGNSTESTSASSTASTAVKHDNSLSGGAIAGVVIGCIAGLALLLALGLFFLRRRKQKQTASNELSGGETAINESGSQPVYESDPTAAISEKDGFPARPRGDSTKKPAELATGNETAFEMESPPVLPEPAELESPFGVHFNQHGQDQK